MPVDLVVTLDAKEPAVVSATKYCVGFAFSEDYQHVVLIRKNRPVWQFGKFNGVGGHVEPGETALESCTREFQEETGLLIEESRWDHFATVHHPKGTCAFFRAFTDEINKVVSCTDELVDIRSVDLTVRGALNGWTSEPVMQNLGYLLPMALDFDLTHTPLIYAPSN